VEKEYRMKGEIGHSPGGTGARRKERKVKWEGNLGGEKLEVS